MQKIRNPLTIVQKTEGGEITGDGAHLVTVYDYDGAVLKREKLDAGEVCVMPQAPIHDRLEFQAWVGTKSMNADGQSVTVGNGDIDIGAIYKTKSGNTEFDVVITRATGRTINIQNMTGKSSVNWGDGVTNNASSHTYAAEGKYTIEVAGVTKLGELVLKRAPDYGNNYTCTEIRIGETVTTIGDEAFQMCYSVEKVTIPDSVTDIGENAFVQNYSLGFVVLHGGADIAANGFAACSSMRGVILAKGIDTIRESFGGSAIKRVVFPETTSSVASLDWGDAIKIYDFSGCQSVPALVDGDIPYGMDDDIRKIIVPDALYDSWVSATNWAAFADFIYRTSEVVE